MLNTQNRTDNQYETLLKNIIIHGDHRPDRTSTGTTSLFGQTLSYNLEEQGFPIITTKKVWFVGALKELLWILSGSTNRNDLLNQGVHIWDSWGDETGELGPVYGAQWRHWAGPNGMIVDQLAGLVDRIKTDPFSRRHVVSLWNVAELDKMALPPCPIIYQFNVTADNHIDLSIYQRSADMFLGVPFDLVEGGLLLSMIAKTLDLYPRKLVWTGGDCHIYNNHLNQVHQQLEHSPLPFPILEIKQKKPQITDYVVDDFVLHNYWNHGPIKAPIAV